MSLHNLWLRRLLSSSHFRAPLPTPADMLYIEWGQNFCLERLLSLSTSDTSMCTGMAIFSLPCKYACRDPLVLPYIANLLDTDAQVSRSLPHVRLEVWISYKSCSYFPITFLSSDLCSVITSWRVIFKFPLSELFNLAARTCAEQSITSLLHLAESPNAPFCESYFSLTLFGFILRLGRVTEGSYGTLCGN